MVTEERKQWVNALFGRVLMIQEKEMLTEKITRK